MNGELNQTVAEIEFCPYVNDDGTVCGEMLSPLESSRDGMCAKCAEKLWDWYIGNTMNDSKGG